MKNTVTVILLLMVCAAIGFLLFGKLWGPPALEVLNLNQVVEVSPTESSVRVAFDIACHADTTITHVETNCDCAVFSELPLTLLKGESRQVYADIKLSKIGHYPSKRMFLFYTNPPDSRPLGTIELVQKQEDDHGEE